MGKLIKIYKVTTELRDHLQKSLPNDENGRENHIDIIDFLLEKRARMLDHLPSSPRSRGDEEIACKIIEMNEAIEKNLAAIQTKLGRHLQKIRRQEEMQQKYSSVPYFDALQAGEFIDKKN